jgi:hypothetical protein
MQKSILNEDSQYVKNNLIIVTEEDIEMYSKNDSFGWNVDNCFDNEVTKRN